MERGKRTSAVRVSSTPGGVLVEHLVVHDAGDDIPEPSAESPEITRKLLEVPGVEPAMLRRPGTMVLSDGDVPTFVAHVLDARRAAPLVLVSVDNATREPLVDPHELARRLAGMVEVVWLSTVGASRRVRDELIARGFSEKFGCYYGGVRILRPELHKGDNPYDHLLVLPVRIEAFAPQARAERIAGLFCEMIAEGEDLRAWLREVEMPPRPEPLRRHASGSEQGPMARASGGIVLREPASPPSPQPSIPWRSPLARRSPPPAAGPAAPAELTAKTPTAPPTAIAPNLAETPPSLTPDPVAAPGPTTSPESASPLSAATPAPEPAVPDTPGAVVRRPRPFRGETPWSRLAGDVVAAAELAEELEDELEETRRELAAARKAQRRAEQERDEAVEARFVTHTVADALALAEASFPERLVVLPSARSSAKASPFRDPARIFEVLTLLALSGRHDGDLEAALDRVLRAKVDKSPEQVRVALQRLEKEGLIEHEGTARAASTVSSHSSPERAVTSRRGLQHRSLGLQ